MAFGFFSPCRRLEAGYFFKKSFLGNFQYILDLKLCPRTVPTHPHFSPTLLACCTDSLTHPLTYFLTHSRFYGEYGNWYQYWHTLLSPLGVLFSPVIVSAGSGLNPDAVVMTKPEPLLRGVSYCQQAALQGNSAGMKAGLPTKRLGTFPQLRILWRKEYCMAISYLIKESITSAIFTWSYIESI